MFENTHRPKTSLHKPTDNQTASKHDTTRKLDLPSTTLGPTIKPKQVEICPSAGQQLGLALTENFPKLFCHLVDSTALFNIRLNRDQSVLSTVVDNMMASKKTLRFRFLAPLPVLSWRARTDKHMRMQLLAGKKNTGGYSHSHSLRTHVACFEKKQRKSTK